MEVNGLSPSLARWAERLKDLTVSPLTRDYPEAPSDDVARGRRPIEAVEALVASASVTDAVRNLRELGTPFDLLLTAYITLVSRLTGDEDVAIGTNAHPDGQLFVLRVLTPPEETFAQLLAKVQRVSDTQI